MVVVKSSTSFFSGVPLAAPWCWTRRSRKRRAQGSNHARLANRSITNHDLLRLDTISGTCNAGPMVVGGGAGAGVAVEASDTTAESIGAVSAVGRISLIHCRLHSIWPNGPVLGPRLVSACFFHLRERGWHESVGGLEYLRSVDYDEASNTLAISGRISWALHQILAEEVATLLGPGDSTWQAPRDLHRSES